MQQYDNPRNEPTTLAHFVENAERILGMIETFKADLRDCKQAASAAGYPMRQFNEIIKRRKMSRAERDEWDSIIELMERELGMLDDTPLGDAARRRMEDTYRKPPAPREDRPEQGEERAPDQAEPEDGTPAKEAQKGRRGAQPEPTPEEIEAKRVAQEVKLKAELDEAARLGREAGERFKATSDPKSGIFANPYVYPDPRRGAWDTAHCRAMGGTGAEAPAHLRRKDEKPKGKPGRPRKEQEPKLLEKPKNDKDEEGGDQ